MPAQRPRFPGIEAKAAAAVGAILTVGCLSGCIPALYHARADAEVYKVLQDMRAAYKIGRADAEEFTIDTPDSDQRPEDVTPGDVLLARSNWEKQKLRIVDAILLGRQSSREFQAEKEQLYLAALTFTGERHRFRPQLIASSTATRSWTPAIRTIEREVPNPAAGDAAAAAAAAEGAAEAVVDGAAPNAQPPPATITITEEERFWEQRGTVLSGAGITQALTTGGSIGLDLISDLLRFYTGDPRKAAVSTLQANIIQPIFRGAGPASPRNR